MKGEYSVIIDDGNLKYDFKIYRNITIVRGDSATGKTSLIKMIRDAADDFSIQLTCDVPCKVVERTDPHWKLTILEKHNEILFFDEDCAFVKTKEFAAVVAEADCYFVIISRHNLETLPYRIREVYEIRPDKQGDRYRGLKHVNTFVRMYDDKGPKIFPDVIITEDKKAGYQFLEKALPDIMCIPAAGKSNIPHCIEKYAGKNTLIIVDGAAFGSVIGLVKPKIDEANMKGNNIVLFSPESFEWIILRSKLFYLKCKKQLEEPSMYIDSKVFLSWERYFTALLVELTVGTPAHYDKGKLAMYYLSDTAKHEILKIIDCLDIM